jgi:hypothetical protein
MHFDGRTIYTIEGLNYCFNDLSSISFSADTTIWVTRVRNRFTLTLYYTNGRERIENLIGKQTLQAALNIYDADALTTMKAIFENSNIYSDDLLSSSLTANVVLSSVLIGDLVIYSDWTKTEPQTPDPPTFDEVTYAFDFVGRWSSLFYHDGGVLSSELMLTADGQYNYETSMNGVLSTKISGVYRLEEGTIALKTFDLDFEYALIDAEDLEIDVTFACDGLISATFIILNGTSATRFEHLLMRGRVRTINYSASAFIGEYLLDEATLTLLSNGTAVISYNEITETVWYRVLNTTLYIFSNGFFGTSKIESVLGGRL